MGAKRGLRLLLIGSYVPLAPLIVGHTPQHSIVVTVCVGDTETPSRRDCTSNVVLHRS
jgi:hypothetical protein